MSWASKPLSTPATEVIAAVRTGITVESIATPRDMLVVREKSIWPAFTDEPELEEFDYVPVTNANEIVGVFDREHRALRRSF